MATLQEKLALLKDLEDENKVLPAKIKQIRGG